MNSFFTTVPWQPENKKLTSPVPRTSTVVTTPEAVHEILVPLEKRDVVVLQFPHPRLIDVLTPTARYIFNLNYSAMAQLNLGQYQCRYVVADYAASASLLKSSGISNPIDCVLLQQQVLTHNSYIRQNLKLGDILSMFIQNEKKLVELQLSSTYSLMKLAQPFLTDLPGFQVDANRYRHILNSWCDDKKQGMVTLWQGQLEKHPDVFPVRLTPNGTLHGRYTASEPSILSMPGELRTALNAPAGYTFVAVDFHQCQPRIMAALSQDPVFGAPFMNGTDYYKMWASMFMSKPETEITATERSAVKELALAWCFGMGRDNLASRFEELGYAKEMALKGLDVFKKRCRKLMDWRSSVINEAYRRHGVWAWAEEPALRRFLPIPSSDKNRNAVNYKVTGTEVTIMLLSIIRLGKTLAEEIPTARIALFLYDELIILCRKQDAARVAELTQQSLLYGFSRVLPNAPTSGLLDCRIAPNWGALKGASVTGETLAS